ncbi:MAG: helix-turn-helix domain-containing protein [Planctomycetota bacterium]
MPPRPSPIRRHQTAHERKCEWQCPTPPADTPLHPEAIGYSRWGPGALQARHAHPHFSLEIPLAGALIHYQDGVHLQLRPGEVLLKHPGIRYRLRPAPGSGCHKLHVGIAGPALPLLLDCWRLTGERAVRCASVTALRAAVARMFSAAAAGVDARELGPDCYRLLELIAQGRRRRHGPATLTAALTHIRRNLHQPLCVDTIAAAAGLSPRGLHRLFRQHLDQAPLAHVLQLRLERAAELLRADPDLLVKQVASRCGIPDQRHFARLFRRHHGANPRQWRAAQTGRVEDDG